MRAGIAVAAAAVILTMAGCGDDDPRPAATAPETSVPTDPTPEPDPTSPTPRPEQTPSPEPTDPSPTRPPSPRLTPTPSVPPESPPPAVGEVPAEYLDAVLADASDRAGVSVGDVTVRRAQAVQWRDGSLGCPEPGMMYTQALVDGYWIELEARGTPFDYRLNERGAFRLCTNPSVEPPPDLRERS